MDLEKKYIFDSGYPDEPVKRIFNILKTDSIQMPEKGKTHYKFNSPLDNIQLDLSGKIPVLRIKEGTYDSINSLKETIETYIQTKLLPKQ